MRSVCAMVFLAFRGMLCLPLTLGAGAGSRHTTEPATDAPEFSTSAGQCPLELVEAAAPSPVLAVPALRGRDAAVHHQHRGRVAGLRERELDQLLVGGIVVEGPGHHQPMRTVDQRVFT